MGSLVLGYELVGSLSSEGEFDVFCAIGIVMGDGILCDLSKDTCLTDVILEEGSGRVAERYSVPALVIEVHHQETYGSCLQGSYSIETSVA